MSLETPAEVKLHQKELGMGRGALSMGGGGVEHGCVLTRDVL